MDFVVIITAAKTFIEKIITRATFAAILVAIAITKIIIINAFIAVVKLTAATTASLMKTTRKFLCSHLH